MINLMITRGWGGISELLFTDADLVPCSKPSRNDADLVPCSKPSRNDASSVKNTDAPPEVKSSLASCKREHCNPYKIPAGLGIRSSDFRANRLFLPKNEQMNDSLKKMSDSLICSKK